MTKASDPYKGDLAAAHARLHALEQENAQLRARLQGQTNALPEPSAARRAARVAILCTLLLAGLALLGLAATLVRIGGGRGAVVVLGGVVLLILVVLAFLLSRLSCVCGPNEALIISGRKHVGHDGAVRGYRVVRGGRCVRMPLVERVDRLDLTPFPVSVELAGVRFTDGSDLGLRITATLRIGADRHLLDRAAERLLGCPRAEIVRIAGEILEGCTRAVMAASPADLLTNDSRRLAEQIMRDASDPLAALGIAPEQLTIV